MEEQKKEQQREHELQCNGLQYTNWKKCIDVGADAEGCHSGSCTANPKIEGAPDTWDGSPACWHR